MFGPWPLRLILALAASTGCAKAARQATLAARSVAAQLGPNHVQIELDRSFIETYRDRATIRTTFTVDAVNRTVNPAAFDGDLHIAGRAPEIGLRLVAEIKNAKSAPAAVAMLRQAEKSRRPLELVGAWRLWPEHAIGYPHRQSRPQERLPNSNPDHVFEIHPLIRVGDIGLLATLRPVEGYRPYSAGRALQAYDAAEMAIEVRRKRVVLTTPAGLYNDVHFLAEVIAPETVTAPDGRFLTARARDLDGNELVDRIRLVLIQDSPPEVELRAAASGTRRHLWGLPRISFAGLGRLIEAAGSDSAPRKTRLPYEIVVLGVYPQ